MKLNMGNKVAIIITIISIIAGCIFFLPDFLHGQDGVLPDTVRVEFTHKQPSRVDKCYFPALKTLGERLKTDPTLDYKVWVGVDSVFWTTYEQEFIKVTDSSSVENFFLRFNLEQNEIDSLGRKYILGDTLINNNTVCYYEYYKPGGKKRVFLPKENSDINNASLFPSRLIAVFQIMKLPLELKKVTYDWEQNERYVKVVVFKKSTELADFKKSTSEKLDDHEKRLHNLESQIVYKWLIFAGWQGFSCLDWERDLSVPAIGLRFSANDFFVQLLGGVNPLSSEGYNHYWYRDVLGSGLIGYKFYNFNHLSVSSQIGGLIGWEYTSETNQFALQVLGATAGLGVEYLFSDHFSVVSNLNYSLVETTDVSVESGKMRSGISAALGILITF